MRVIWRSDTRLLTHARAARVVPKCREVATRKGDADSGADDVTGLLVKWRQGDKAALDDLIPIVYRELRRIASARLRGERPGNAIQTTALVHEAYLRLAGLNRLTVANRTHFFAIAARLMRQILVDLARRAQADSET